MASNVYLQYKGKTNLQHGKNVQVTKLQDDLRDRVLSLEQDFIQFLKPSDVIFSIQGLDDDFIDTLIETESHDRKTAVRALMKEILKDEGLVTQFVYALETQGYKRFIDPIHRTFPDKGTTFCQEYFEFIIKCLKGELIEVLDALTICGNLYQNGCLELRDKEDIEAIYSRSGRTAACQRLFQIARRRKANWALLFVEAIKESQEYVKCKMDPSSTNEDLKRTGIVLRQEEPDVVKAFRNISQWTTVSGENEGSYSKRQLPQTIDKKERTRFEINMSITNLFACNCVIMTNQIVFCNRNVLLLHNLDGNFIREISVSTSEWIYGMAVISDNFVAVTYDDCCHIDIVNIKTDQVTARINTIDSCFKITCENELMYAIMYDTMINVMDMSGNVIRSFSSPSLYINNIQIDKDKLLLTDCDNSTLYCCDLQGNVMWKFADKDVKELHGVTTDKHGNVYIVGSFTQNIIVITENGTHFKELISICDDVTYPIGIFYNKSKDCLLVCSTKGKVFLFDILHSYNFRRSGIRSGSSPIL